MVAKEKTDNYGVGAIQALEGIEHVRKPPGCINAIIPVKTYESIFDHGCHPNRLDCMDQAFERVIVDTPTQEKP